MKNEDFNLVGKTAFLLPTNICNLNCAVCCTKSFRNNDTRDELTLEQYRRIIGSLKVSGYKRFDISGGEPFLRDDISDIIGEIKSGEPAYLLIVTNGSIAKLSLDKMKHVLDLTDELRISIDSHESEKHDLLRGKNGAFYETVDSVRSIREAQSANRIQDHICKIGINFIWVDDSSQSLLGIYELANKLEVDHLEVLRHLNVTAYKKEPAGYESIFSALEQLAGNHFKNLGMPRTIRVTLPSLLFRFYSIWKTKMDSKLFNSFKIQFEPLGGCSKHLNNIVVGSTGDVSSCVTMLNCPDLIGSNYCNDSGSLQNSNIKIKQLLSEREKNLHGKEPCKSCKSFFFCRGGCPVEAFLYWKTINSVTPSCPYINNELKR